MIKLNSQRVTDVLIFAMGGAILFGWLPGGAPVGAAGMVLVYFILLGLKKRKENRLNAK